MVGGLRAHRVCYARQSGRLFDYQRRTFHQERQYLDLNHHRLTTCLSFEWIIFNLDLKVANRSENHLQRLLWMFLP